MGTYRLTYVEQAGDCGPIDSQLVSFNPAPDGTTPAAAGCTLNSERWSEGDCKLERDTTCSTPSGSVHTIAVSHALSADAAEITGTASFTIGGRYPCNGTYALDATRQ